MALEPLIGAVIPARPLTPAQGDDPVRRFVVGQTLRGVVLRALPEGQTLVNFNGQQVALELGQRLAQGQTFLATVEQTLPTLVLKIAGNAPLPPLGSTSLPTDQAGATDSLGTRQTEVALSAAQLKPYLMAKQPFGDTLIQLQRYVAQNPLLQEFDAALLQRLTDTLTVLLPSEGDAPDAARLQAQVEQSGLSYEAKAHQILSGTAAAAEPQALRQDLKGQLLELFTTLDRASAPSGDLAEARQHVQQALQSLEFQQLANVFAQQEHQALLLQFLHPSLAGSHTARLYVRTDPGNAPEAGHGETPGYTLVFLLDFTALGPVRLDATVRGSHIAATLRTAQTAVADFMTAQTPELITRLQALGFEAAIHCRVEEQVPFEIEDTLTRVLRTDHSHLLDFTV